MAFRGDFMSASVFILVLCVPSVLCLSWKNPGLIIFMDVLSCFLMRIYLFSFLPSGLQNNNVLCDCHCERIFGRIFHSNCQQHSICTISKYIALEIRYGIGMHSQYVCVCIHVHEKLYLYVSYMWCVHRYKYLRMCM